MSQTIEKKKTQIRSTRWVLFSMLAVIGSLSGCGPKVRMSLPEEGAYARDPQVDMERIKADPEAFFADCLAETRKIKTLRMKFQRQERLGIFNALQPAEHIDAEYRDVPFSVRFTWTDPESEYRQCVYVEGENDSNVALLPRRGLFGLPARVGNYAPQLGVTFSKTRNPITDFGPRRLMERTLDRIQKARPFGKTRIRLVDLVEIGPASEPCYHFELIFPKGDQYAAKLQDLYIHTQTHLPVATYVWQSPTGQRTGDSLVAMYLYGQIEPNVPLTNDDFILDANRRLARPVRQKRVKGSGNGRSTERVGSMGESGFQD